MAEKQAPGPPQKILGNYVEKMSHLVKNNPALQRLLLISKLCSHSQIPNNDPYTTSNYLENATLEQAGTWYARAKIGDKKNVSIGISPTQGEIKLDGLDPKQKKALSTLCSRDNLPESLKDLIYLTGSNTSNPDTIIVNLITIGQSKQRFIDGFTREVLTQLELINGDQNLTIDWATQPFGGEQKRIPQNYKNLRSNSTFAVAPSGVLDTPSWTIAERATLDKAIKSGSSVYSIFEPSGKGKTFLVRNIIKESEKANRTKYLGDWSNINNILGISSRLDLNNRYLTSHERYDNLTIVSPANAQSDITEVIADFESLLTAKTGNGPVVLIVDNAHDRSFPKDGAWLDRVEGVKNLLSQRRDGSGIFILGEHEPSDFNASTTQGHRIERMLLPFTQQDLGLTVNEGNVKVNTNAPGYDLIKNRIEYDEKGKTMFGLAERIIGANKQSTPEMSKFVHTCEEEFKTLVNRMSLDLIRNPIIREMFEQRPEIANFLSRSHLGTIGEGLNHTLLTALEDTTDTAWVVVNRDGSFIIDDVRFAEIIKTAAGELVNRVTVLAKNKLPEPLPDFTPLSPTLNPESIVAAMEKKIKELSQQKLEISAKLAYLQALSANLINTPPEDMKIIAEGQRQIALLQAIITGKAISPEMWTQTDRSKILDVISSIAQIEELRPEQVTALTGLTGLLTVAQTPQDLQTMSAAINIFIQQLGTDPLFTKSDQILTTLPQALEALTKQ